MENKFKVIKEVDEDKEEENEKLKNDIALANKVREAYPSMSDSSIMKQIC